MKFLRLKLSIVKIQKFNIANIYQVLLVELNNLRKNHTNYQWFETSFELCAHFFSLKNDDLLILIPFNLQNRLFIWSGFSSNLAWSRFDNCKRVFCQLSGLVSCIWSKVLESNFKNSLNGLHKWKTSIFAIITCFILKRNTFIIS